MADLKKIIRNPMAIGAAIGFVIAIAISKNVIEHGYYYNMTLFFDAAYFFTFIWRPLWKIADIFSVTYENQMIIMTIVISLIWYPLFGFLMGLIYKYARYKYSITKAVGITMLVVILICFLMTLLNLMFAVP